MNINWKVRAKNKNFWLGLIPAVIVLAQLIAKLFGYEIDLGEVGNTLREIINLLFTLLAMLGIVNDPTTKGISDSSRALTYSEPRGDESVG